MSFDGLYNITVKTPMGKQKGKLTIRTSGNSFSGELETASGDSQFTGGVINGNQLQWEAETKTPLGSFQVSYRAKIEGEELSGEASTPMGKAPMTGAKI